MCGRLAQFLGNSALLALPKVSFLSSRKIAPGTVLRCYDWAVEMREAGRCVISGFHSPLEKDVMKFLLKGTQPIVLILARRLYKTVPPELREALEDGRLLIVSPVPETTRRADAASAAIRNRYILDHSDEHVFGSIDPEGSLAPLAATLPPETSRFIGG